MGRQSLATPEGDPAQTLFAKRPVPIDLTGVKNVCGPMDVRKFYGLVFCNAVDLKQAVAFLPQSRQGAVAVPVAGP